MAIQDEQLIKQLETTNLTKNNLKNSLENLDKGSTVGKTFSEYHEIIDNYPTIKKHFEKPWLIDIDVTYWVKDIGMMTNKVWVEYTNSSFDNGKPAYQVDLNQQLLKSILSDVPEGDLNEFWNPHLIYDDFVTNASIRNSVLLFPETINSEGIRRYLGVQYKNKEADSTFLVCYINGNIETPTNYNINIGNASINSNNVKIWKKTSTSDWEIFYQGIIESSLTLEYQATLSETIYFKIESEDYITLGNNEHNCIITGGNGLVGNGLLSVFQGTRHAINIGCFENNIHLRNVLLTKLGNNPIEMYPDTNKFGSNTFTGCYLENIVIPDRITEFGYECFEKSGIRNIFANGVTKIGKRCFKDCLQFNEVNLPNLTHIISGENFLNCENLGVINLPKLTESDDILKGCFQNCKSLKRISIPIFTTGFGDYCFAGCHILEYLYAQKAQYIIGDDIFLGCNQLSVVWLNDLKEINGNNTFMGCYGITSLDLPMLTKITGNNTFSQNPSMRSLYAKKLIEILGDNTFLSNEGLVDINLENLTKIGSYTFAVCYSLNYLKFPKLSTAGLGCFSYCNNLESIKLPIIAFLKQEFFKNCDKLKNINFPLCTGIETNVFQNCQSLTEVFLPKCLTIDKGNFVNKQNLKTVDFVSCTVFKPSTFAGCKNLEAISINSCITIESNAFEGCSSLKTIYLPVCTTIGISAFADCSSLETIDLPICEIINIGTFNGCRSLKSINLQKCLNIDIEGFKDCSNLKSIDLPVCTYIGSYAFQNCTNLITVKLPVCTTLASSFISCSNLKSIDLPNCKIINNFCFQYCLSLETVRLPNLVIVRDFAFANCQKLKSIDLPNCTIINKNVFRECSSLETVRLPVCTTIGQDAFYFCNNIQYYIFGTKLVPTLFDKKTLVVDPYYTKIFVPNYSLESYKNQTNWVLYKSNILPIEDFDEDDFQSHKELEILYFEEGKGYTSTKERILKKEKFDIVKNKIPERFGDIKENFVENHTYHPVLKKKNIIGNTLLNNVLIPNNKYYNYNSIGVQYELEGENIFGFLLDISEFAEKDGAIYIIQTAIEFINIVPDTPKNIIYTIFGFENGVHKQIFSETVTYGALTTQTNYTWSNKFTKPGIYYCTISQQLNTTIKIGGSATFMQNNIDTLISVFCGKNIKIGGSAFFNCVNLKNVIISDDNILKAEDYVNLFSYDKNIEYLVYPVNNDTDYTKKANFSNMSKLKAMVFHYMNLFTTTFENDYSLENLDLALSNTNTDDNILNLNIFNKCRNLKNVEFFGFDYNIETNMFNECTYINFFENIINVSTIKNNAFKSSGIKFIHLNGFTGLCKIGNYAFANCYKLRKAIFPNFKEVGTSCFDNCIILKSIKFNNIDIINNYAFNGCLSLRNIKLPNTLKTIGDNVFTSHDIENIQFESIVPPTLQTSSSILIEYDGRMLNKNIKIWVPDVSLTAYKTATNWILIAAFIFPVSKMPEYVKLELDL